MCTISALVCDIIRFFLFCRGSGWESWGGGCGLCRSCCHFLYYYRACDVCYIQMYTIRQRTRCGLGISNGSFNLTRCYRPRTGADLGGRDAEVRMCEGARGARLGKGFMRDWNQTLANQNEGTSSGDGRRQAKKEFSDVRSHTSDASRGGREGKGTIDRI